MPYDKWDPPHALYAVGPFRRGIEKAQAASAQLFCNCAALRARKRKAAAFKNKAALPALGPAHLALSFVGPKLVNHLCGQHEEINCLSGG